MSAYKKGNNTAQKRHQCGENQTCFSIICFVIVNLNGKIICKILPFFIRDADIDFLRAVFAAVFILSIYRILQRINVVNSAFIDK